MTSPADLKAWRARLKLSQSDAAVLLGKSRASVQLYEQGRAAIPDEVAAIMAGKAPVIAEDAPPPTREKATRKRDATAAPDDRTCTKAISDALKRNPLFAKTTAEAFAMRDELARRGKVDRSTTPLIPLRPDWVTFGKFPAPVVKINAAIPRPVKVMRRGEGWSVLSADGRLYDYETAAPSSRAA